MNNNSEYVIRQEQPADFFAVENLTREAFWNVYRPGCLEHYVLHCYRADSGFIPELSLVLEQDGELLAHVMFAWSKILVDADSLKHAGEDLKMMTFGPISVRPDMQRKGIGKMLLDYALQLAQKMGGGCVAMCGNIQFYGKCGFVVATSKGIRYAEDPEGDAPYFLIRELTPGFLDGVHGSYRDPEAYFVSDSLAEEFDKQFPAKEKLVLPGQLQ